MRAMNFARLLAVTLIVVAAMNVPFTASAEEWKPVGVFGWLGVGTAYQIEKGHIYWVGEFSGTFFNDKGNGTLIHKSAVKCSGFNDLDFNNKKSRAAGYCVISDRDGDQAYLDWACDVDTEKCKGTFDWTGGTGKYANISGANTFSAAIVVNYPDGKASGYSIWNR